MRTLKRLAVGATLLMVGSLASAQTDADRIFLAADQLVHSQTESGLFAYDFDFDSGYQSDMAAIDAANLVRQSGGAFSLGEYLLDNDNPGARSALEQFLAQAEKHSLPVSKGAIQKFLEATGLYNRWQLWGMLGDPLLRAGLLYQPQGDARLVSQYGRYDMARPGATALAMLAALDYRSVSGDSRFDLVIEQWKDGLLVLAVSGRGIRKSPVELGESAYDNAETWYALAAYLRAFPDDASVKAALNWLDEYIFEEYGGAFNVHFYHWGTMAAAVRYEVSGDMRFYQFMQNLTEGLILAEAGAFPEANSCALVEGLATYLAVPVSAGEINNEHRVFGREFIYRTMSVNRRLQIDEQTGRKFRIDPAYNPQLHAYQGAFLKSLREPLMQVDLTQHCLNALLRMQRAGLSR